MALINEIPSGVWPAAAVGVFVTPLIGRRLSALGMAEWIPSPHTARRDNRAQNMANFEMRAARTVNIAAGTATG